MYTLFILAPPDCAVCSTGYGRGVANTCHRCTAEFKAGMYFVLVVVVIFTLVVVALLAIYLVSMQVENVRGKRKRGRETVQLMFHSERF